MTESFSVCTRPTIRTESLDGLMKESVRFDSKDAQELRISSTNRKGEYFIGFRLNTAGDYLAELMMLSNRSLQFIRNRDFFQPVKRLLDVFEKAEFKTQGLG